MSDLSNSIWFNCFKRVQSNKVKLHKLKDSEQKSNKFETRHHNSEISQLWGLDLTPRPWEDYYAHVCVIVLYLWLEEREDEYPKEVELDYLSLE